MYCPECGSEVGDANFCAACGADLKGVRQQVKGRGSGAKTTGSVAGAKGGGKGAARPAAAAQPAPARGPSAALLWGIVGVVVVVVVVAVMLLSGDGTANDQTADGAQPAATTISADTSGSYQELVDRGNSLYDQGNSLFQGGQIEQGSQYFQAASVVYMAAWKKQPGDPSLGTDMATSLFYAGDTEGALKQIDNVLEENPDFQPGWFNKGNYLAHAARFAEQSDEQKLADKLYGQAREAYTKAISMGETTEVGKAADERLAELPK